MILLQVRSDKPFRLGLGSFIQDYTNRVQIVSLDEDSETLRSNPKLLFNHPYPPTKLQFIPDRHGTQRDLLATSSDFVRLWHITSDGITEEKTLQSNAPNRQALNAPITSFDWNEVDLNKVVSASIDTTVSVWDIEQGVVDTHMIAHDKEVYDVTWGGVGVFASVSADGSVRVFDLRDKEHSTIIYETTPAVPLLRLAWNRQDPRFIAVLQANSSIISIIDVRFPTKPVASLARHGSAVNAMTWAPHSSSHLCSAGDDRQALIWDLSVLTGSTSPKDIPAGFDPILAYNAGTEISQLQWSALQPDWVAICFGSKMQILRV